jgi:hypothetical protein
MSKRKLLMAVILVLATLASACDSQRTGTLLFSDDFTQTTSGWDRLQNDVGSADYADGSYHIMVNNPQDFVIAVNSQVFDGDVSVEVDARKIDGTNDNYFGVVCHYQDPDNYYMLMITSGGSSAIGMMKDGEFGLISPGLVPLQMEGIKLDDATNHIRADCVGEQMTLFANGKQISLAYDSSFIGGRVGLVSATGQIASKLDIRFDNFQVYQP